MYLKLKPNYIQPCMRYDHTKITNRDFDNNLILVYIYRYIQSYIQCILQCIPDMDPDFPPGNSKYTDIII